MRHVCHLPHTYPANLSSDLLRQISHCHIFPNGKEAENVHTSYNYWDTSRKMCYASGFNEYFCTVCAVVDQHCKTLTVGLGILSTIHPNACQRRNYTIKPNYSKRRLYNTCLRCKRRLMRTYLKYCYSLPML